MMHRFFDLGAMSEAKERLIRQAMEDQQHDCEHPVTAHTGTDATWPWKLCARTGCKCQILAE